MAERSPGSPPRASGASTPWWRPYLVPAVLAVLAIIFVLENRDLVSIRLWIPVVVMPQWVALVIMLVIGFVIGALVRRRRRT